MGTLAPIVAVEVREVGYFIKLAVRRWKKIDALRKARYIHYVIICFLAGYVDNSQCPISPGWKSARS